VSPRPDVSEQRRSQILQAASRVFARRGFQETRMDDIVSESGLSKGALYWYFESKDDIIIAIVDSVLDRELAHIRALVDDPRPARERLMHFVEFMLEDFQNLDELLPMVFEIVALAIRNASVQPMIESYFRSTMESLVPIIEQGIEAGEFRPVDAQAAAIAVGAQIEGTILLQVYDRHTVRLADHVRSGLQLLLSGLDSVDEGG
jgi:AcrR family transcriptional regulator